MKTYKVLLQAQKELNQDIKMTLCGQMDRVSTILGLKNKLKPNTIVVLDGPSVPSDFDDEMQITVTGIQVAGSKIQVYDGINEPELIKVSDCSDDVMLGIIKELEKIKTANNIKTEEAEEE